MKSRTRFRSILSTFTVILSLLQTWSHAIEITAELEAAIINCTSRMEYIVISQSTNSAYQCLPCHSSCSECYGPSSSQCYKCQGTPQEVGTMEDLSTSGSGIGHGFIITNDGLINDTSRTVIICESNPFSTGVIIGIAVGSAVAVLVILCLCVCLCCFCCTRRRRKQGSFKPMTELKEQYPSLDNKDLTVDKIKLEGTNNGTSKSLATENHVLQEQHINVLSVDTEKVVVTNHQQETVLTRSVTPPPILSQSMKEKGYIPMSSAGSIRPSKSMGDIDISGEQDIYEEPVEPSVAFLRPTPPPTNKPPVLPKPPGLTPTHKSTISNSPQSSHSPSHSQTVERTDSTGSMEDYVAPDVFRADREKQELIDSYYNSETIESIRLNKDPATAVLDPSKASLYVNLDQPTSSHSLKSSSSPSGQQQQLHQLESPDDGRQNVEDFLGTKQQDETTKGDYYYNIARFQTSPQDKEEKEADYNYIEHVKHNLETSEDDQYVYMKSGHHTGVEQVIIGTPPSPSLRHQSEPGKKIHKYMNLPYDQSGQLLVDDDRQSTNKVGGANTTSHKEDVFAQVTFSKTSPTPKPRITKQPVSGSSVNQSSIVMVSVNGEPQEIEGDDEQPLYVNVNPDDADEGGEELYENVR